MLLYKYRQFDDYSLENLSRATLRCSEVAAFNDPYELQFELEIRGGQAELDALYEYWRRKFPNQLIYRRTVRIDAADIIKGSRKWYGICCFSEVPTSYSSAHTSDQVFPVSPGLPDKQIHERPRRAEEILDESVDGKACRLATRERVVLMHGTYELRSDDEIEIPDTYPP